MFVLQFEESKSVLVLDRQLSVNGRLRFQSTSEVRLAAPLFAETSGSDLVNQDPSTPTVLPATPGIELPLVLALALLQYRDVVRPADFSRKLCRLLEALPGLDGRLYLLHTWKLSWEERFTCERAIAVGFRWKLQFR